MPYVWKVHKSPGMSVDEFKAWMMENFDANKDGMISTWELRDAIAQEGKGHWFNRWWMARRALHTVDKNNNGLIDMNELGNLGEFAKQALGIEIIHVKKN